MKGTTSRRTLLAGAAAAITVAGTPAAASATSRKPTIVLVHGAFADASGWAGVISELAAHGYPVVAPANPLRTLSGDANYLKAFLGSVTGPIVLAGHSYGGAVITNAATGNPNVKALVYVAAFAPDAGETVGALQGQYPGSLLGEQTLDFRYYPLADGTVSADAYIKTADFHQVFAADLPRSHAAVLAATQRPADARTLGEPSGEPAWKTIPSHFVISRRDNAIPATAQRFMAGRAHGTVTEVSTSHAAMIAAPLKVAAVIRKAAG